MLVNPCFASFVSYIISMNRLQLIVACCVLSFGTSAVLGQERNESVRDTLTKEAPRYVLSVQRVTVGDMKINDTLSISLNSFGYPMAGFDLKFAVENPLIDIVEVLPGEIYDSCRWEYFDARQVPTAGKETYPPIVWHAVALANLIPDTVRPLCFSFNREASLIKLVVSSEHVAQAPDTVVPIFFFWEDCSDNTIASVTGDTLAMSAKVIDYFNIEHPQGRELFPCRTGAPKDCINPRSRNKPQRLIEFYNGGVEFKLDLGDEVIDSQERGIER